MGNGNSSNSKQTNAVKRQGFMPTTTHVRHVSVVAAGYCDKGQSVSVAEYTLNEVDAPAFAAAVENITSSPHIIGRLSGGKHFRLTPENGDKHVVYVTGEPLINTAGLLIYTIVCDPRLSLRDAEDIFSAIRGFQRGLTPQLRDWLNEWNKCQKKGTDSNSASRLSQERLPHQKMLNAFRKLLRDVSLRM